MSTTCTWLGTFWFLRVICLFATTSFWLFASSWCMKKLTINKNKGVFNFLHTSFSCIATWPFLCKHSIQTYDWREARNISSCSFSGRNVIQWPTSSSQQYSPSPSPSPLTFIDTQWKSTKNFSKTLKSFPEVSFGFLIVENFTNSSVISCINFQASWKVFFLLHKTNDVVSQPLISKVGISKLQCTLFPVPNSIH